MFIIPILTWLIGNTSSVHWKLLVHHVATIHKIPTPGEGILLPSRYNWRHSQSSCVNIFHAMSKWKIVLPLLVLICSICTGNFLNTAGSWSAQWSKKGYVQSVNRCMYCFNIFWKTLHLTTLTDCLVHFIASLKSSKASLFNFAVGKDTIQIDQSYLLTKCSIEICDLLWRRPQTIKKMDLGFTEEMIFLMHCY